MVQKAILKLMEKKNLADLSLREISELIGVKNQPQRIKHHILQLEKKGLIILNKMKKPIKRMVDKEFMSTNIISLPIVGSANCGPATIFAEQNIESYLKVSDKLLKTKKREGIFVLKADGNSLNKADISGKSISNGDYVVIDSNCKNPKNGEFVLSIIDGLANLKEYREERKNNKIEQIILLSKSTEKIPPIYIHENDDYMINGKIIQVIKKPKIDN